MDVAIIFFGIGGPLPAAFEQAVTAHVASARPDSHPEAHLTRADASAILLEAAPRPAARLISANRLRTTLKRGIGRGGGLDGNGHSCCRPAR